MTRQVIPAGPLWLGYAGVLPFAALAGTLALGQPAVEPLSFAFLLYSGLILSFLGGIRWGVAASAASGLRAYVYAVLPSLWAFACLLLPSARASLWGLLAGYLALGAADFLRPPPTLPGWMPRLRLRLTLAVAACHVILLLGV